MAALSRRTIQPHKRDKPIGDLRSTKKLPYCAYTFNFSIFQQDQKQTPSAMPAAASVSARYRHERPLDEDIVASNPLRTTPKKRKARRDDELQRDGYVDSRSSRKILKIGQELEEEEREASKSSPLTSAFAFGSRFPDDEAEEDRTKFDDDEAWGDEDEVVVEDVEIDANDLDMFNKFVPAGEEPSLELKKGPPPVEGQGTNLADLILQQIAAHEAQQSGQPNVLGGGLPEDAIEIPAKVIEVYTKVGMLLSRYKSGKLPKPFKILPTLPQWEDLISITRPEAWTPNACYEATRIFISGNKKVARRFIETVLLERVREEIHETRKLNTHLFKSLQKATFKPEAFFKGFLFPLVDSGSCTLREAHVISGVLTRASIPPLHSAAALMRLTDIAAEQASASTESGGATNIFIKTLLDKQYALPYKVVDNLVFHFLRFRATNSAAPDAMEEDQGRSLKENKLPVLWHQTLLAFAQRYRNEITEDQREALLDLLLIRGHKDIGPEVRRELLAGRGRGVPVQESVLDNGDDTMAMDPS